jgi:hypothetical protein
MIYVGFVVRSAIGHGRGPDGVLLEMAVRYVFSGQHCRLEVLFLDVRKNSWQ